MESADARRGARPASAVRLAVGWGASDAAWARVEVPFAFRTYGKASRDLVVSAHGWLLPGAAAGFDEAAVQGGGGFPLAPGPDSADGVLAVLWTRLAPAEEGAGVWTWTSGSAPARRFVVSWEGLATADGESVSFQAHLCEDGDRIVLVYGAAAAVTGVERRAAVVVGLDERGGARFTAPVASGAFPATGFVLTPRTVLANAKAAPRRGEFARWEEDPRREYLTADDSARRCPYVAKGQVAFFVPDRAAAGTTRRESARRAALADEDRRTFGGEGDRVRWVRQVLDGKAHLVLRDGKPVRFWFRVVEYFSVEDDGSAGPDDHVWNLRVMLSQVFDPKDPRSRLENYAAWRATAAGRMTVVKLFDARAQGDASPQFDTGRRGEYVVWCSRYKADTRGALPDHDVPDGWKRFPMKDEGRDDVHREHAPARDLRETVDPNYVDGGYEYVVLGAGGATWVNRGDAPLPAMTDERVEDE